MKANYLVLLLVISLFAGHVTAQPNFNQGCNRHGHNGMHGQCNMNGQSGMQGQCLMQGQGFFGIPDLSDDQKKELQKLKTEHMKEVMPLKNEMNEKQAHLVTLSSAANPDINAIYAEIEKIGQIKIDLQKKKAKFEQDIRKLLTDEQRLFFDMHSAKSCMNHQQEMKHGMPNWGN
jgi:Spy/CpxP family protein refolding chaperone